MAKYTAQCDDHFSIGCTFSMEYDDESELSKGFYKKNKNGREYYQKTCKECTKKRHRELYKEGSYDWRKRNKIVNKPIQIGASMEEIL